MKPFIVSIILCGPSPFHLTGVKSMMIKHAERNAAILSLQCLKNVTRKFSRIQREKIVNQFHQALPCLRLLFNRSKPLLASSFFQNLVTFAIVAIFVICVLASMKNPCYFCDICGHFGVPFGFFFSKVVNLDISVILEMFVRGASASEKNPCYFCDFCDI